MAKVWASDGCILHVNYYPSSFSQEYDFWFPPIYYKKAEHDRVSIYAYDSDKPIEQHIAVTTNCIDRVSVSVSEESLFNVPPEGVKEFIENTLLYQLDSLELPISVRGEVARRIKVFFENMPNPVSAASQDTRSTLARQANTLPGIKSGVVLPCNCFSRNITLKEAIIHLNDREKWTREQIADWLDELADKGEIDIDFPTPDKVDFDREAVNNASLPPGQDLTHFKEFKPKKIPWVL